MEKNAKKSKLSLIIRFYKIELGNFTEHTLFERCIVLVKTATCLCELLIIASGKHLELRASKMSGTAAAEKTVATSVCVRCICWFRH